MASDHDEMPKAITEAGTDPPKMLPADGPPKPAEARPPSHRGRKILLCVGAIAALAIEGYLPDTDGGDDVEHGVHRRRLRQWPRDLRGSPGPRPGDAGPGG